jgi:uncharacterized protein (DUF1697 family)
MTKSQQKYVALLRAINVGGKSMIKMPDLRKQFEALGLKDVVTYIQTGNVVFTSPPTSTSSLAKRLEKKLESSFGYKTRVFVLSPAELKKAAANNPFSPDRLDKEQHCHLVFLSSEPARANQKALLDLQGKEYRFAVKGKVFYYAYSREVAGSRRRSINFEKVLGVTGTARTWKVIKKLIELSN